MGMVHLIGVRLTRCDYGSTVDSMCMYSIIPLENVFSKSDLNAQAVSKSHYLGCCFLLLLSLILIRLTNTACLQMLSSAC